MKKEAETKLLHALWSIHNMLDNINKDIPLEAEDVDTLEQEIEELENLLG